jgi:hypothetical protein
VGGKGEIEIKGAEEESDCTTVANCVCSPNRWNAPECSFSLHVFFALDLFARRTEESNGDHRLGGLREKFLLRRWILIHKQQRRHSVAFERMKRTLHGGEKGFFI